MFFEKNLSSNFVKFERAKYEKIIVKIITDMNDEFKEYQFSVDNLEEFTGYKIKIVMSGTNEAKAPAFKDLRTIALA